MQRIFGNVFKMNNVARQRPQRQLFEFQKNGQPSARPPAGHKPDLVSLSVVHKENPNKDSYFYSNYNRNRAKNITATSLNFIDLKSLPTNPVPQVSSSYDNKIYTQSQQKTNKNYTISVANRTFDTLFLVDLLNTSKFDQITEINASSHNLCDIDITTLKQLQSVKKADFSDNSLPLEPFSLLQNLEELDMSCNGLKKFEYDKCEKEYISLDDDSRAWNSLHTLNLSHNMCSNMISDLQLIPLLSNLNLSSNSISTLPSNLMYFTCLTCLDLSHNNLNSDSSLFSLATIPSLQILNLDYNGLVRVPKFQFGFEALIKISLRSNYFEESDDFDSLADLITLQEVNIVGNPIITRGSKYLAQAQKIFASAKINLICHSPTLPLKSTLTGNVRTVPIDPLTLPFYSRAHRRALNESVEKKSPVRATQKVPPLNLDQKAISINSNNNFAIDSGNSTTTNNNNNSSNNDDVFMTSFLSKPDENKGKINPNENENDNKKGDRNEKEEMLQRIQSKMKMNLNTNDNAQPEPKEQQNFRIPNISPTRIQIAFDDEDSPSQTNFWSEIPVVQEDRRRYINRQVGTNYSKAFNQLQFIVLHPEANPGNVDTFNRKSKRQSEDNSDDEIGCFDGNYYNNEKFVYSSEFNKEYHEGDEIDEIQDILQKRREEEDEYSRNPSRKRFGNKARLKNRFGATPIPSARKSRRSTNNDDALANEYFTDEEEQKLTREEINGMIQDMDDKLLSIERDLQEADDERMAEKRRQIREKFKRQKMKKSGRNSASDDYLDYDFDDDDENGDRFARLNKQYENIRANLVKTLTES